MFDQTPATRPDSNASTTEVSTLQERQAELTRLYAEAKPRMMAVARRVVRNEADAEDTVQQAFISAYKSLDRYEGRAQMTTWLHRITHNAALMQLRTKRRKGAQSLDALPESVSEVGASRLNESWALEPTPTPDKLVDEQDLRAEMDDAICDLKALDQRIVRRLLESEWTVKDVAQAEGMSPGAVKSRLHRARKSLRASLSNRDVVAQTLNAEDVEAQAVN